VQGGRWYFMPPARRKWTPHNCGSFASSKPLPIIRKEPS
jgi:hypothetical protein